jgi:Recombinase.
MLTEETGDKWNAGKIRYILKNEKYIGDSLFQKTYTTEILPFKGKRNNGELPKYYVEGTHEPIIDKETFHAVQELMTSREGNKRQRQTHTFTKTIVCGNCGHTFKRKIVNGRTYWTCANHNTNSDNCPIKAIPESDIQDAYIRLFNKLKCNAEIILAPAIRQLEDLIMKKQAGNSQLLTVRSDLISARDRINQVTRLYESGILSAELYNGQKKEAEAQINRLRKMMTAAVDTDELADRADRLSDLMDTVVDGDIMYSFEESTFEMTVEKITAMSDTELKFRLVGGIEFAERL